MKSRLFSSIIILILLIAEDYIIYLISFSYEKGTITEIADFIIKSVLIFIFIQNLLYNALYSFKSSPVRIVSYIFIPLMISLGIADRFIAISRYYTYSKTLQKFTTGNIWRFDDSLSYIGIPGVNGYYNYYIGDSIEGASPVVFDSLGFRTYDVSYNLRSDTTDLFLGCSYTFGDYIDANLTFPYLVAKKLNHDYINGGISGYGFGQMYQIAHRLIPKKRFKYVFIQVTDWLSIRAMDLNGPTRFGYRPFPYFSDLTNSFQLNLPAYSTLMYSNKNWRKSNRSYIEKMKFSFTDGIKIEIHDYLGWQTARLQVFFGLLPEPTKRKQDLELFFYQSLIDLCLIHGATPVFYKIQYPDKNFRVLISRLSPEPKVADIDMILDSVAKMRKIKPGKIFRIHHVLGNDSVQYDAHPNIYAHSLYAQEIINVINK